MKTFPLEIVTPDGAVYSGEAQALLVRTGAGDVEILADHIDYLATVLTGRCRLVFPDGTARLASASGGFLSVSDGKVRLVTTTFEYADEIDLNRARVAKERAQAALRAAKDEREAKVARAKLERALNRIRVAEWK